MNQKTISERAFEVYLADRGITKYKYEEDLSHIGITKPVDYSFEIGGKTARFEVKEWEPQNPQPGFSGFDPYSPIRDKIDGAREKFQQYKKRNEPCILVLCHYGSQPILLGPAIIYAAMRGDFGWRVPVNIKTGACGEPEEDFLKGGKMWDGQSRAWNTTISAIAVIKSIDPNKHRRNIKFRSDTLAHEKEIGRELSSLDKDDFDVLYKLSVNSHNKFPVQCILRLLICDNVDASINLPAEFPSGPYDERYGLDGDWLRRIYIGPELLKIEQEKKNAGIEENLFF
ncbi:hypothetical protein JXA32_04185 [Candidatus Sumerlaeota bacterium]|nr:hypothetical protein [Candidatus Sumerlaeota bacterium]